MLNKTLFWQRKQVCLLKTEASFEQLRQSILPIFLYIVWFGGIMNDFFPFVHEKKKEELQQPLYIELYPSPSLPPKKEEEESESESGIIIIQF